MHSLVRKQIFIVEERKLDYCDRADIEEAVWTNDDRVLTVPADGFCRFTKTINRIFNRVDWSRVVMVSWI